MPAYPRRWEAQLACGLPTVDVTTYALHMLQTPSRTASTAMHATCLLFTLASYLYLVNAKFGLLFAGAVTLFIGHIALRGREFMRARNGRADASSGRVDRWLFAAAAAVTGVCAALVVAIVVRHPSILARMLADLTVLGQHLLALLVPLRTTLEPLVSEGFSHVELLFFAGASFVSVLALQKRRVVVAAVAFGLALAWIAIHKPVVGFINALGVDSISELDGFSIDEAMFWLSTAGEIFRPDLNYGIATLYFLLTALAFLALVHAFKWLALPERAHRRVLYGTALVLVLSSVYLTTSNSIAFFWDNSRSFLTTRENFSVKPQVELASDNQEVQLLVYIGESTSAMNMGLYGYPRKTTPQLRHLEEADAGLLKFSNVMSTHTHTAWSLLEALSLDHGTMTPFLPINYRQRSSVVDLLVKAGVETILVSNQGESGTWNQASPVIFGKATTRVFSTRSKLFGNDEYKLKRPWDHEYFQQEIPARFAAAGPAKRVTFFHSYGGHGKYLDNIPPEFRSPVDDFVASRSAKAIAGKLAGVTSEVEAYDSAIRYVDYSVSRAAELVRASDRPSILVYFSDHGDAVYAARGHDSTRFIHEMARVPFVIYFNEAARRRYPDLFRKYRQLSQEGVPSTLAQLPGTLFDLLGVGVKSTSVKPQRIVPPVIGQRHLGDPIAVRETPRGTTFVDMGGTTGLPDDTGREFVNVTDHATRYFSISSRPGARNLSYKTCYHAANTFAKARRGAMVADCLEADFMVEPDGRIAVYHPPLENTGFNFDDLMLLAAHKSLWIDAKNLSTETNCMAMARYLHARRAQLETVLVELPSGSHAQAHQLGACTQAMRRDRLAVSYYLPTELAVSCSEQLAAGRSFKQVRACTDFEDDARRAHGSGLYTDISFDYLGLRAVESTPFLKSYAWNTWNVAPQQVESIKPERFRMIIPHNDDPNSP